MPEPGLSLQSSLHLSQVFSMPTTSNPRPSFSGISKGSHWEDFGISKVSSGHRHHQLCHQEPSVFIFCFFRLRTFWSPLCDWLRLVPAFAVLGGAWPPGCSLGPLPPTFVVTVISIPWACSDFCLTFTTGFLPRQSQVVPVTHCHLLLGCGR